MMTDTYWILLITFAVLVSWDYIANLIRLRKESRELRLVEKRPQTGRIFLTMTLATLVQAFISGFAVWLAYTFSWELTNAWLNVLFVVVVILVKNAAAYLVAGACFWVFLRIHKKKLSKEEKEAM
jgi:hypothetical protein